MASNAAHIIAIASGGFMPRSHTGPQSWPTSVVSPPASAVSHTWGESQMHMRIDASGRDDEPAGLEHRRAGVEHHVDPVHGVGVARSAQRHDPPVADPDRRHPNAQHRVEHQPADDGDLHSPALGPHTQAVAHGVAPPRH